MTYYLAAFMLQAYVNCTDTNLTQCGFSSWVEFEPSRYEFEDKSKCIEAANEYVKQFRTMHKKSMTIVYTIPACPEYKHEFGPQAFGDDAVG